VAAVNEYLQTLSFRLSIHRYQVVVLMRHEVDATAGKDVVYQLSGQPGDTVDITLSTTFDSALYALTDCSDFTSCLDGSDSGNPETIQFVLTDTNPVYVVVDAWSSGNGPATLTVMITPP